MTDLAVQTGEFLRRTEGVKRGARIMVAVSGGVDSCVLLHLLHQAAPALRLRLIVAHFNHQLRGAASDQDEALVRRMARRLDWPCEVGRADVAAWSRKNRVSIEMAARQLRHEFLARAAVRHGARCVATAHHADDQVELFFLRLLRGAGPDGLAGMRPHSPSPADAGVTLVRPLLDLTKTELHDYARRHKIRFREDATNHWDDFQRNRIRRRLLPFLRKSWQPALDRVILRAMRLLGDEADHLETQARLWLGSPRRDAFASLHPALQRAIIVARMIRLGADPDYECVEHLRNQPGVPRAVRDHIVLCSNRAGQLTAKPASPPTFKAENLGLDLQAQAASALFDGVRVSWRLARGGARPRATANSECFDADRVGAQIVLRHWQKGDRFQPLGLGHSQKLQDWFINRKVPRELRHQLVLATTQAGEIFWIEGQRIAEPFKITPRTRRVLRWTWQRQLLS
jgi:tRNA(Ile)-lysidine synthase